MAPGLNITTSAFEAHCIPKTNALFIEHKESSDIKEHHHSSKYEADIVSLSRTARIGNLLQASPYDEHDHLLDLTTLTEPLQLFAKALTDMRAIRSDYATAPYHFAFNWYSIIHTFTHTASEHLELRDADSLDFFVIVFRSRINENADRQLLGELDSAAHVEAVEGGGLLKYWFGTPNADGRNLATCTCAPLQGQRDVLS